MYYVPCTTSCSHNAMSEAFDREREREDADADADDTDEMLIEDTTQRKKNENEKLTS